MVLTYRPPTRKACCEQSWFGTNVSPYRIHFIDKGSIYLIDSIILEFLWVLSLYLHTVCTKYSTAFYRFQISRRLLCNHFPVVKWNVIIDQGGIGILAAGREQMHSHSHSLYLSIRYSDISKDFPRPSHLLQSILYNFSVFGANSIGASVGCY